MHIPDGYLSPSTSAVMYSVSLPFLAKSSQTASKTLRGKAVPLTAFMSAFTFVVMMFNIPLPGGTTGHAVGATVATIVLGPQLATVALTVALTIQAVLFGDGGILTLGANIFNMAIIMPAVSWVVYSFLTGRADAGNRGLAAGVAGYAAINVASLLTAVELGIQPALFTGPDGHPLYFPYPLAVTVPAMLIGHLTVAGLAESLLSVFTVRWLSRAYPDLVRANGRSSATTGFSRRVWYGIALLALATPVGLLAPGTAWGEWNRTELAALGLGFIPAGYDRWSGVWNAPFTGYAVGTGRTLSYIMSGFIGIAAVGIILILLPKLPDVFGKHRPKNLKP